MLELFVAIEVGRAVGALAVFGLLVLMSVLGAFVVRRQGSAAWRAVNAAARTGTPPSRDLADAAVLMLAGVLLILPGFCSDVVALLLLLPFTRPVARRPVERFFRRAAADQAAVRTAFVRGPQFGPAGPAGPGAAGPAGAPGGGGRFGPGFGRDDVIEGEIVDDDPRR
ncbi:FxsA family protein [Kineosporia sp. J2-2]|uniref:FxsA family protein n=1 Tax=Kineosporia corallincola TaxID=2835133 RepID=A0ABS5TLJ7_9ACTN|nr:FxsA family protein [Kineosporia corallincola]